MCSTPETYLTQFIGWLLMYLQWICSQMNTTGQLITGAIVGSDIYGHMTSQVRNELTVNID